MPTVTFYPEAHPETSTVDGFAWRISTVGWADAHDGAGSGADSGEAFLDTNRVGVLLNPSTPSYEIDRGIWLFDTSTLPDTAVISSASLNLYVTAVEDVVFDDTSRVVLCASNPASNNALVASDYSTFGTTAFSASVLINTISLNQFHSFPLNATGIAAISLSSITKLAMRVNYDLTNEEPAIVGSDRSDRVWSASAEYADSAKRPFLTVTYDVPSVTEDFESSGYFARQDEVGRFFRQAERGRFVRIT